MVRHRESNNFTYRKSGHPQPRSNRHGPGIPYRSTAPAIRSGLRSFWEGRKRRRSGCVLITATMSIRSSSGLLMMIVLIDLAKRSQQDRRASIEYEKAEPQCVDSAMPPVLDRRKGFRICQPHVPWDVLPQVLLLIQTLVSRVLSIRHAKSPRCWGRSKL